MAAIVQGRWCELCIIYCKERYCFLPSYGPVHRVLHTGDFSKPSEAGVCLDKEKALDYVREQFNTFKASFA